MIKKLQRKIIIIVSSLLTVVVVIIMLMINITAQLNGTQQIRQRLESISNSDGRALINFGAVKNNNFDTQAFSFYIKIDKYNAYLEGGHNSEYNVNGSVLIGYAEKALDTGREFGYIDDFAFLVTEKIYGKIIVFTDAGVQLEQNKSLVLTTVSIGSVSVLVFFGLSVALSFWLVCPVKDTLEKQKRFISDASHELKTPIAVISANADVLEAEIGDNKWLSYIRDDAARMSELVNELLSLARLDDKSGHKLIMSEFSLSDAVLQTALPFESRMFEMGKNYDVDVQSDIVYKGDESAVKHIVSILIDNAVKYSDEKAEIKVKLYTKQNKKIIEVYNTGNGIPEDKLEKIFERFYREDEARNRKSGGYGLGLSIAREIVRQHSGSICAKSEYGKWVSFIVTL